MNPMLSRDAAVSLLRQHIRSPRLIRHALATEAVMRALARRLDADPDRWGLAGLLHDLDVEQTLDEPTRHTHLTLELLADYPLDAEILEAIRLHNEAAHPDRRSTRFQHALAAGETITGLIVATAMVYPDQRLASVKAKSVRKRFREKAFAAGADRDIIRECELCGIPLDEFCAISLEAMQAVSEDLDL